MLALKDLVVGELYKVNNEQYRSGRTPWFHISNLNKTINPPPDGSTLMYLGRFCPKTHDGYVARQPAYHFLYMDHVVVVYNSNFLFKLDFYEE